MRLLLGRRNILRLYKGGMHFDGGLSHVFVAVERTGDARFCVSTGLTPSK